MDEYGNEDIRKSLLYILNERHKITTNKNLSISHREERLLKLQQQYPLTIQESFQSEGTSKFDSVRLNNQINYLTNYPPQIYRSNLTWEVPKVKVLNQPNRTGKFAYIEEPKIGSKYSAGGGRLWSKAEGLWIYWCYLDIQAQELQSRSYERNGYQEDRSRKQRLMITMKKH